MIALFFSMALGAGVPDLYSKSYDAEATADYAAALDALEQMPSVEKQTYVYRLRRAWLLYLRGEYRGAVAAYEAAAKLKPKALEPRLGVLLPLLADRRWLDADREASGVLKVAPGNTVALTRRAWARYNLGRYAEAEADYRAVHQAFPSDVDMVAGLGWCRKQQGDAAGARTWFEAALHVAPRHASARAGLDAL